MSRLRIFQVDAFTSELFGGNPAAVVPLVSWPDDELMQSIAAENNLAETAFFVPADGRYGLRWFTPTVEVKLCGHATLATAHVLFTELEVGRTEDLRFETVSGELVVGRRDGRLTMDFPTWRLERLGDVPDALAHALGAAPREVLTSATRDNLFAVFDDEATVASMTPSFAELASLHPNGVAVTASSRRADFVYRYFAPSYGIDEDPGTGSMQCALVPYWAARLGKGSLRSMQVSRRGAEFVSELRGDRVLITGSAVTYLDGWIDVSLQLP